MTKQKKICKVQVSINGKKKTVLVYDEKQTFIDEFPATKEIIKAVGSDMKKFFYYHLDAGFIILDGEAPWQKW